MKLKAIENVLIKCQSSKGGQMSTEANQVVQLLDDMKNNVALSMSPSPKKSATWKFIETSPHSPGGKKPFLGGAK